MRKARAKTRCKVTASWRGATPPAGSSGPSGLRPRFARPTRQPPRGFAPRPCGLTPSMVHQSALRARPHCHHHCERHHQRFSTVQIPLSRRGSDFLKGRLAIRNAWYCAWNRQGALFETGVVPAPCQLMIESILGLPAEFCSSGRLWPASTDPTDRASGQLGG